MLSQAVALLSQRMKDTEFSAFGQLAADLRAVLFADGTVRRLAAERTNTMNERNLIVGHTWEAIQRAQQGGRLHEPLNLTRKGDFGADPVGDGTFKMVPSGDIVTLEERNKRLGR